MLDANVYVRNLTIYLQARALQRTPIRQTSKRENVMSEEWVPEAGLLIYRQLSSLGRNEITIAFNPIGTEKGKYRTIAIMEDFAARKRFEEFDEASVLQTYMISAGLLLLRDYASDAVLTALVKLWTPEFTPLNDWLAKISDLEGLADSEKDRLLRIVKQVRRETELEHGGLRVFVDNEGDLFVRNTKSGAQIGLIRLAESPRIDVVMEDGGTSELSAGPDGRILRVFP